MQMCKQLTLLLVMMCGLVPTCIDVAAAGDARKAKAESKNDEPATDANTQKSAEDPSDPKTKDKPPEPNPVPTEWSAEEIQKQKQICEKILSPLDAVVLPEQPFRKGDCGTPAPVRLVAIGSKPQVVLSPPAVMTCRLAVAVHQWATTDLQKIAKKHLDDEIIRIEVMSDYSCRNTYGRATGRRSQHAFANALDVRGFGTANGNVIRLLTAWGPTARDIAAEKARLEAHRLAELEAEKKAKEESTLRDKEQANQSAEVGRKKTAKQIVVKGTQQILDVGDKLAATAKTALTKVTDPATKPKPLSMQVTKQGKFLRDAHKTACKIFGTTLGPEANNAHRNHFHLDMKPRRRSNYCE